MKTLKLAIGRIALILLLLTLNLTVSCREKSEKEESIKEETKTEATTEATTDTTTEITKNNTEESNAPLNSKPKTNSSIENNGSPMINSGGLKVNPAHGQPGHRCDIKVGDPL